MNEFTIRWISWGRSKKAHAQVQKSKEPWYVTICGMGFEEYEESTKPHCITCEKEIRIHKKEGWKVNEEISTATNSTEVTA